MFYRPQDGHGLPHNPFSAIISPRPIGWISTRGPMGDNLAPYSFFNAIAYAPPQVMFASTGSKDSLAALQTSGVFCVNIVAVAQKDDMNATSESLPRGVDEFTHAGVARAECETIDCPRVAASPASLECRMTQVITLSGRNNFLILGEVTGIHMRDDCMVNGRFDVTRYQPLARLGYRNYTVVREVIELARPDED